MAATLLSRHEFRLPGLLRFAGLVYLGAYPVRWPVSTPKADSDRFHVVATAV
jgi:hypothetical protein